ncbi:hypothetical protein D3C71_1051260 [compost metagenome]
MRILPGHADVQPINLHLGGAGGRQPVRGGADGVDGQPGQGALPISEHQAGRAGAGGIDGKLGCLEARTGAKASTTVVVAAGHDVHRMHVEPRAAGAEQPVAAIGCSGAGAQDMDRCGATRGNAGAVHIQPDGAVTGTDAVGRRCGLAHVSAGIGDEIAAGVHRQTVGGGVAGLRPQHYPGGNDIAAAGETAARHLDAFAVGQGRVEARAVRGQRGACLQAGSRTPGTQSADGGAGRQEVHRARVGRAHRRRVGGTGDQRHRAGSVDHAGIGGIEGRCTGGDRRVRAACDRLDRTVRADLLGGYACRYRNAAGRVHALRQCAPGGRRSQPDHEQAAADRLR